MKDKELKTKTISFRVSEEDEQEILEKAKEAKITISNFCRRKAKGLIVKAPTPLPPIADKEMIVYAREIVNRLDEIKELGHEIDQESYNNINNLVVRVSNRLNNVRAL